MLLSSSGIDLAVAGGTECTIIHPMAPAPAHIRAAARGLVAALAAVLDPVAADVPAAALAEVLDPVAADVPVAALAAVLDPVVVDVPAAALAAVPDPVVADVPAAVLVAEAMEAATAVVALEAAATEAAIDKQILSRDGWLSLLFFGGIRWKNKQYEGDLLRLPAVACILGMRGRRCWRGFLCAVRAELWSFDWRTWIPIDANRCFARALKRTFDGWDWTGMRVDCPEGHAIGKVSDRRSIMRL